MSDRTTFREDKVLYLRPLEMSDVPLLYRWINDPEVTQFLNRRLPATMTEEEEFVRDSGKKPGNIVLMIVLKGKTPAEDRPIGTMGVHGIERENGVASTGALIGEKDCWGKGYGARAKTLFLDFLFNTLNLRKIYSHVLATNPRSRAYSERCGYVLEATLKERHFRNGRYLDEYILSITAETWRTQNEKR